MVEVHLCKVPGCSRSVSMNANRNKLEDEFGEIYYYQFPVDTFRKNKWLEFCSLPLDTSSFVISQYRICSAHFSLNAFKKANKLRSDGEIYY